MNGLGFEALIGQILAAPGVWGTRSFGDGVVLMGFSKTVLTTGEVAKICNVAPRTVSKWFDSGHLPGYRIPGSKDRRIPMEHLIQFMRSYGIPLNGLESGRVRVLVFDSQPSVCQSVSEMLSADTGYEVRGTSSAFEAGAVANEFDPHVLLVDVILSEDSPENLVRFLRKSGTLHTTKVIGMSPKLSQEKHDALLALGFDAYLEKPFGQVSLVREIEKVLSSESTTYDQSVST